MKSGTAERPLAASAPLSGPPRPPRLLGLLPPRLRPQVLVPAALAARGPPAASTLSRPPSSLLWSLPWVPLALTRFLVLLWLQPPQRGFRWL